MNHGQPFGGQWNYDSENRESVPAHLALPEPFDFCHDASEVVEILERMGIKTMGNLLNQTSWLPLNREESLQMLKHFCTCLLPFFGRYEDAMVTRNGTLFHSLLSFSLNTKMLSPLEVVEAAIAEFGARPDEISLPQIEGFVRQIIGWREYMRGVYWARMPEFSTLNFFNHDSPLPSWFWTGETKMKCMRTCIQQSLNTGFAHHIQRLMVTGNFALLYGAHPDEVDQWYLGIYVDAIEWVQITNTRGMSQYADGGFTASKPYVSSARYIRKMSDYCTGCHYNPALKTGARSCPFNSLYWDFHDRHQSLLQKNPRIGMTYRTWEKMKQEEKLSLLERAAWIRSHPEEL
jgi:deoxyribodipyrimidine photolyase-related protein